MASVSSSYVPATDAGLLDFGINFQAVMQSDPARVGIGDEQFQSLVAAQAAYAAAYRKANDQLTRTPGAIEAKNLAKTALIAEVRRLVPVIQVYPGTTDEDRTDLRITIRDGDPTPIGPPEVMPVLRIVSVVGRVLDLELRREDGTTRRKPKGVRAAWLYTWAGEDAPGDLSQWQFRGSATKSNPQVVFAETVAPGTAVWVTALWVSPTDQPGPACSPIKTHINFDGMNNQQAA